MYVPRPCSRMRRLLSTPSMEEAYDNFKCWQQENDLGTGFVVEVVEEPADRTSNLISLAIENL